MPFLRVQDTIQGASTVQTHPPTTLPQSNGVAEYKSSLVGIYPSGNEVQGTGVNASAFEVQWEASM